MFGHDDLAACQRVIIIPVIQMRHRDLDGFGRVHVTDVQDQHALVVCFDLLVHIAGTVHGFIGIRIVETVMEAVIHRDIFTFISVGTDLSYGQLFRGSSEIQAAEAFLGCDQRPVFGYPHVRIMGIGSNVFVMTLHPRDQLGGVIRLKLCFQDPGSVFAGENILKLCGISVVCDPHVLQIRRQAPAAR